MANTNTEQNFENVQDRLAIPRQTIPKRAPADRVNNFEETYLPLQMDIAIVEASRCIDINEEVARAHTWDGTKVGYQGMISAPKDVLFGLPS